MPRLIESLRTALGLQNRDPSPQTGQPGVIMRFAEGRALIVGVGADLPNTVNDAEGIEKILVDQSRCAYPTEQVRCLTAEKATRGQILAELNALAAAATTASTVVVYFSGHGYRSSGPAGEQYYLCPFGYDIKTLETTCIRGDEFSKRLEAIKAKKLLLLLDCCHAGGIDQAKVAGLAKAPLPAEVEHLLAEGKGWVGIASSRKDEVSFAGTPYSAFTVALLESLSGTDVAEKDGFVRASDIALHAAKVVPQRTKNRQNPVLEFKKGADNFRVAYYAAGATQAKGPPFAAPPEIEPEAGEWGRNGRTVVGTQIVVNAPVAFLQPGWNVRGPVTNVQGNAAINLGSGRADDDEP